MRFIGKTSVVSFGLFLALSCKERSMSSTANAAVAPEREVYLYDLGLAAHYVQLMITQIQANTSARVPVRTDFCYMLAKVDQSTESARYIQARFLHEDVNASVMDALSRSDTRFANKASLLENVLTITDNLTKLCAPNLSHTKINSVDIESKKGLNAELLLVQKSFLALGDLEPNALPRPAPGADEPGTPLPAGGGFK